VVVGVNGDLRTQMARNSGLDNLAVLLDEIVGEFREVGTCFSACRSVGQWATEGRGSECMQAGRVLIAAGLGLGLGLGLGWLMAYGRSVVNTMGWKEIILLI